MRSGSRRVTCFVSASWLAVAAEEVVDRLPVVAGEEDRALGRVGGGERRVDLFDPDRRVGGREQAHEDGGKDGA